MPDNVQVSGCEVLASSIQWCVVRRNRHCWVDSANINAGWAPKSFCVADEHYIPTLLASLGKDNETDCMVSALFLHAGIAETGRL